MVKCVFVLSGVIGVFLGNDFVIVIKDVDVEWDYVKLLIFGVIMEYF